MSSPEPATYEIAGQTVTMPCVVRDASAGTAMFTVDAGAVLPTIGSKELVAWLPTLLGLGPGDVVAIP